MTCLIGCLKDPPNSEFLTAFLNGTPSLLPSPPATLFPPSLPFPRKLAAPFFSSLGPNPQSHLLSLSDPTSVHQQILLAPPSRCSELTPLSLPPTAATFIQASLTTFELVSWLLIFALCGRSHTAARAPVENPSGILALLCSEPSSAVAVALQIKVRVLVETGGPQTRIFTSSAHQGICICSSSRQECCSPSRHAADSSLPVRFAHASAL